MSTGEGHGATQLPDAETPPAGPCPYCGAIAARDVEEAPGDGILGVTFSVCAACGRSMSKPRWTRASTRRALLIFIRALGSAALFAVVAWLLAPLLSGLRRRSSGPT